MDLERSRPTEAEGDHRYEQGNGQHITEEHESKSGGSIGPDGTGAISN